MGEIPHDAQFLVLECLDTSAGISSRTHHETRAYHGGRLREHAGTSGETTNGLLGHPSTPYANAYKHNSFYINQDSNRVSLGSFARRPRHLIIIVIGLVSIGFFDPPPSENALKRISPLKIIIGFLRNTPDFEDVLVINLKLESRFFSPMPEIQPAIPRMKGRGRRKQ